MDRTAYVVLDTGGNPVYASFDETLANANAEPGQRIESRTINPETGPSLIVRKCDPLEILCLANASTTSDMTAFLAKTKPRGEDGRYSEGKGGPIRYASFDKVEVEWRTNSWTQIRSVVVKPSEVALDARGKLDALEKLLLDEELARQSRMAAIRARWSKVP